MKKLSILFATILVLVSSIIFSACKEGYKNLKIECDVSVVELVLDDSDLSYQDIVFKISGVKSWGEVAIDSKPSGQVQVAYVVDGKNCLVRVQALQPTGDGATLDITHLGSGKMFSVPLKIGMKLRTIESNNKDFIIETPKFDEVDEESEKITIKEIEIPSKQLLICSPSNYTDTIVWKAKEGENVEGVEIVSYNIDGEVIQQVIEVEDESTEKVTGISTAVKSVIKVSEGFDKTKTLKINPISILDGKAVWHTDVTVEVKIMDLLQQDSIVPTSTTHGSEDGVLKDLVLISNPDPNNKREDSSNTGYDYYSTAVIDLSSWVDNPDFKDDVDDEISEGGENLEDEEGLEGDETEIKPEKILQIIDEKFASIYDIEISSDIEGLMLEKVGFTKIRAIASITCVGAGNIKVDFVPKDCVGDIKVFSVDIPCIVGERATGFKASVGLSKEKEDIEIVKENTTFSGVTYLRDAGDSSYGQAFKFEVLSTNTLQALTKYQITIYSIYQNFHE